MVRCSPGALQTANISATNSALTMPKKCAFRDTAGRIAGRTIGFRSNRCDKVTPARWLAGSRPARAVSLYHGPIRESHLISVRFCSLFPYAGPRVRRSPQAAPGVKVDRIVGEPVVKVF